MNIEGHLVALIYMSMWVFRFSVEIIYSMWVESRRLFAIEYMAKAWWMSKTKDAIPKHKS